MINFNLEEAEEKTIEYLNKKSYSLIRPDFTKYSGVYPFTTENLSYLKKINILDKNILTVTGSFDHCLNLVYLGAKSITNFDINLLTVCYGYLKYAALKKFSYEEYLNFFCSEKKFDYQYYQELKMYIPSPYLNFWNFIYEYFSYDSASLLESHLFHDSPIIENTIKSNPYLENEETYNYTKSRIAEVFIDFEEKNILEIGTGEKTYDVMLFSNIESYLVEDVFSTMKKEEFIEFIKEQASNGLNENGIIQMAYQYQYKIKKPVHYSKSFFKRLFQSNQNYSFQRIDYLEGISKKIIFSSMPLINNTVICDDIQDCIYLYQKKSSSKSLF